MATTETFSPSGRGGSLLPAGYLSTSGSQLIDANGNPVRIDSIGWNGPDGPAGSTLQGLSQVSFQTMLDAIKADGFNTVRIPWSDVSLTSMPSQNAIDFSKNPSLQGLNVLQIFQQIVAYSGQVGLKIIFDHHTDDGGPNGWGGQQANGLWFDSGPGSDGTDGSGTTGTVTAAKFQQDTVTLAKTFAGNATVIGFDLDNEPTAGSINWGQGGATDIQAMYTTVGNAIQAVDPGALIIAEGPQEYSAPGNNSGMNSNVTAPEGDLTGVAAKPVVLNVANKVVYSVHEYPSPISAFPVDSGTAYVQHMNAAFGYLISGNIAPVWIGEMGASLDGTAESSGAGLADEQAWASTLLDYMNGKDGALGGPTFTGAQQGISGSWWLAGSEAGQYPDGIQSAWGSGNYRAAQQAITDQLLFIPKAGQVTQPFTPSANNTVVLPTSTTPIVDTSGNKWSINSSAQVAVNGVADTTTANVIELAYVNGAIWQENASKLWWGETTPNASWGLGAGTATSPLPATSPDNMVVMAGSTAAIVDASGNKWTITSGAQVAVNGVADTTTANVIELAYVKGMIWQENASKLWWGEAKPNASWAPTLGSATSPLPVVPPTSDTLVLKVSEDAYLGDAAFTVTVDGVAVGGTRTATASHRTGQDTTVSLTGNFGMAPTVVVKFTNDLYGGSSTLDRNLYVDGITYDGIVQTASAALPANGAAMFALHGPATAVPTPNATLALTNMAGAVASLPVIASGTQVSAAGSKANLSGTVRQVIDSTGVANISTDTFGSGIMSVATKDTAGASYHFSNFASTNVELGGATAGSLTIDTAAGGNVQLDSGNYAVSIVARGITAGSAAQNQFSFTLGGTGNHTLLIDDGATHGVSSNVIHAGAGADAMQFIAAKSVTVFGGAGVAAVTSDAGTNLFTAGTGTLNVKGGAGADTYTYHTGNGLLVVQDFSLAKGDVLNVDKAMSGTMTKASDGANGLMISFGTAGHGIDLIGYTAQSAIQIHYV